jgi:hypothetical protein
MVRVSVSCMRNPGVSIICDPATAAGASAYRPRQ